MIKQTKKKVFALLGVIGLIGILSILIIVKSPIVKKQITKPEVVEQKSVIEEQAIILPYTSTLFAIKNISALKFNTITMDVNNISKISIPYEYVEPEITKEEIFYNGWTNTKVNVRIEPNINSEILATFKYNTNVKYTKVNEEWVKIKYENDFAYINNKYISDTEGVPLNPYIDLIDTLTSDEKYLIYQITFLEAGNQSMEGQRAVIEVILNRVLSANFPDTVEGVLSQPEQFATWSYRNSKPHNKEQEEALKLVYEEKSILTLDYFMFSRRKFSWAKNYIEIGDHWFGTF